MPPADPHSISSPLMNPAPNGPGSALVPVTTSHDLAAPALPPALHADAMDGALLRALRRCWLPAVGLGLAAGLVAAAVAWFAIPSRYTAQALVHVSAHAPRGILTATEGADDFPAYQRTQAALLKSRAVLQAALRRQEVSTLSQVQEISDPAGWLYDKLVIDSNLGPEILRVSLSGTEPEALPVIVNAVVQAYLQEVVNGEQVKQQARLAHLMDNYRDQENNLRRKRTTLKDLEVRLGVDPQTAGLRYQAALQQLALAEKELFQTKLNLGNARTELAELREQEKAPPVVVLTEAAIDQYLKQDPVHQRLVARQSQLQEDIDRINSLAASSIRDAQLEGPLGQLAALTQAMKKRRHEVRPQAEAEQTAVAQAERKARLAKLQSQANLLQGQEKGLEAEIKRQEGEVKRLGAAVRQPDKPTSDLEALRDEVAQADKGLQKVGDQILALKVEPVMPARASLLEAADVPQSPTLDRKIKVVGLIGIGVFALAVLGVAWREYRARRVYEIEDLTQGLGMDLLGALPGMRTARWRAAPRGPGGKDVYWQALLAEAVDGVRTRLLHASHREPLHVLLVTSATGGEGKTSLTTHLAASLARARRKTLLVDGDLRNPAVHRQFELPLEPGLAEVLRGAARFEEVVRPTSVAGLAVVSAGRWDGEAVQALAREEGGRLFDALRQEYDFVLVDSSPVLPVADTLLLGQHVDGVVFSVLRDVSRLPAVFEARQRLAALGIRFLGAVMIGTAPESAGIKYPYAPPIPA